jgi:hypothetical protein
MGAQHGPQRLVVSIRRRDWSKLRLALTARRAGGGQLVDFEIRRRAAAPPRRPDRGCGRARPPTGRAGLRFARRRVAAVQLAQLLQRREHLAGAATGAEAIGVAEKRLELQRAAQLKIMLFE